LIAAGQKVFPGKSMRFKSQRYPRAPNQDYRFSAIVGSMQAFWPIMTRGILGPSRKATKEPVPLNVAEFEFR
jgi:hypothetical protein